MFSFTSFYLSNRIKFRFRSGFYRFFENFQFFQFFHVHGSDLRLVQTSMLAPPKSWTWMRAVNRQPWFPREGLVHTSKFKLSTFFRYFPKKTFLLQLWRWPCQSNNFCHIIFQNLILNVLKLHSFSYILLARYSFSRHFFKNIIFLRSWPWP